MKQGNIAILILVAGFSLMVSYIIGNSLINKPQNRQAEVEVVEPIEAAFPSRTEQPLSDNSDKIFNQIFTDDSINPTEVIQIGDSQSDQPFSGAGQ